MSTKLLKTILASAVVSLLLGCSGEADEAKKLGFANVDEMKQVQAKGWHSKERFDEDEAKLAGYNSVVEMKNAIAAKKIEEENIKAAKIVEEKARQEAEQQRMEAEADKRGPPTKWREGLKYTYYGEGEQCTESGETVCLTAAQFKSACEESSGVTQYSLKVRSMLASHEDVVLLTGGDLNNVSITYGPNRKGNNVCSVTVTMSGLVDGNSKRSDIWGNASSFIKNAQGKVLVSQFSSM